MIMIIRHDNDKWRPNITLEIIVAGVKSNGCTWETDSWRTNSTQSMLLTTCECAPHKMRTRCLKHENTMLKTCEHAASENICFCGNDPMSQWYVLKILWRNQCWSNVSQKHKACCEHMFIAQNLQQTNWQHLKVNTRKTWKPKHTRGSLNCVH